MYSEGKGVSKDSALAVQWYRKAAEQGLAEAQYNLGYMYANGDTPREFGPTWVQWFSKAADQGLAGAQYTLGVMYAKGDGVPRDLIAVYMSLNLSAAQGNESAKQWRDTIEKQMTRRANRQSPAPEPRVETHEG